MNTTQAPALLGTSCDRHLREREVRASQGEHLEQASRPKKLFYFNFLMTKALYWSPVVSPPEQGSTARHSITSQTIGSFTGIQTSNL